MKGSRTKQILMILLFLVILLVVILLLNRCGRREIVKPPQTEVVPQVTEYNEPLPDYVKRISFPYEMDGEYTADCFYSDRYFEGSGYDYNASLATMSLSFAMSAFASASAEGQYVNARKLLEEIGAAPADIAWNENYEKRPETDTIGVIIGSKPLTADGTDYTLLALAVRGAGYGREWAGNFTIGTEGQHSGFEHASETALGFLREYIKTHGVTGPVKLWVTGFSRAAATANLICGAVDRGADLGEGVTLERRDLYGYCFETPAGALVEDVRGHEEYYNIFNIINQSDPVPYVAPSALGFGRYGVDRYLPSAQSSSTYVAERAAMLKRYDTMARMGTYTVDDFQMKKVQVQYLLPGGKSPVQDDSRKNYSQGVFLSNYVTIIAKDFIKNRDNYAAKYEDEIREVCYVLFGSSGEEKAKLAEAMKEKIMDGWPDLLRRALDPAKSRQEQDKRINFCNSSR